MSATMVMLAADQLLPVRMVALVALAAVILSFVYVALHLKRIERMISSDDLIPAEHGPRNNVVLMICAIPVIVTSLLLFLVIKA